MRVGKINIYFSIKKGGKINNGDFRGNKFAENEIKSIFFIFLMVDGNKIFNSGTALKSISGTSRRSSFGARMGRKRTTGWPPLSCLTPR